MTEKPIPIDLNAHVAMIEGAREFLRAWVRSDGASAVFVNPVPVGADPADFGAMLVDCVRQGAKAYARAVGIDEDEAAERIWAGIDAERPRRPGGPLRLVRRLEEI